MRTRELKRAPGSGINSELHRLFEALRHPDSAVSAAATAGVTGAAGALLYGTAATNCALPKEARTNCFA